MTLKKYLYSFSDWKYLISGYNRNQEFVWHYRNIWLLFLIENNLFSVTKEIKKLYDIEISDCFF